MLPEKPATVPDYRQAVTALPASDHCLIFAAEPCVMPHMSMTNLQQLLEESFHPPAADGMDAVLRIQVGTEDGLTFRVRGGTLTFLTDAGQAADTTFRFADRTTAQALFSGQEDAFAAFMDGRFRADGYLMWAFTLMAMFRSASLPVTPVE